MPADYGAAAGRHWSDAEHLLDVGRVANADHLYGVAAECALKVALLTVTGRDPDGGVTDRYRRHVDRLWDLVPLQGLQRRYPSLALVLRSTRPFDDWRVHQRYENGEALGAVDAHRQATRRLCGAVGLLGSPQ